MDVREALRSGIDERVDRALRQPEAGKRNEQRDADGNEGIGLRIAERGGAECGENENRVDEVGGEMQRICFERLASRFARDLLQRPPPPGIDKDRDDEHDGGDPARRDGRFAGDEPAHALKRDGARKQKKEGGLDERGKRLDLAVAILVLLVRRLVGGADGKPCDRRRGDVEERVGRIRDQRQGPGRKAGSALGEGDARARRDGPEGCPFLAAFVFVVETCHKAALWLAGPS